MKEVLDKLKLDEKKLIEFINMKEEEFNDDDDINDWSYLYSIQSLYLIYWKCKNIDTWLLINNF